MHLQKKISLQNIKKKFLQNGNDLILFSNVCIDFEKNITYAIMGPSGCGKSTLLALLTGSESPTEGDVVLDGKSIHLYTSREKNFFLKRAVSIVLQQAFLNSELSSIENVALKGMLAGLSYPEAFRQAENLLHEMGLGSCIYTLPLLLSQGQQQRVALARALISRPDFLLADEPTANLDKKSAEDIISVMLSYQKKFGFGLIVATHDLTLSQKMEKQLIIRENRVFDTTSMRSNKQFVGV